VSALASYNAAPTYRKRGTNPARDEPTTHLPGKEQNPMPDSSYPLTVASILYLDPAEPGTGPRLLKRTIWASLDEAANWMERRLVDLPVPDGIDPYAPVSGEYVDGWQKVTHRFDATGKIGMQHRLVVDTASRRPVILTPYLLGQRRAVAAARYEQWLADADAKRMRDWRAARKLQAAADRQARKDGPARVPVAA
jgi:hypothetical protein